MNKNCSISELWEKRYRTKPPLSLPETETLKLQLRHKTVRDYREDPVPSGILEAAIAAASSAASSNNLQTWSVVAVHDAEKRQKLAELCGGQKHVAEAPLFLAWIADLSRLERIAQREGKESDALSYQESFLVSSFDTALAAQNAVIAFESFGLGTVYIGGLRNHPEEVAALLALPQKSVAVVGMCVGSPKKDARGDIKPRLSQEVVLHHESYQHHEEETHISAYDQRAHAYHQEQGQEGRLWSHLVSEMMAKAQNLGGRHHLRSVLERLGFHLK